MQVEVVHCRYRSQNFRHRLPITGTSDPEIEILKTGVKLDHALKLVRGVRHYVFAGGWIVLLKFEVLSDGDQRIASLEFVKETIEKPILLS